MMEVQRRWGSVLYFSLQVMTTNENVDNSMLLLINIFFESDGVNYFALCAKQ